MKHGLNTLEASNTDEMTTDENTALFEKVSPAMRGSLARDVVSEYRRWTLGQIAAASRSGVTERLQEMEELKEKLDREFNLVIRSDQDTIFRALTEYRIFLTKVNKAQAPQSNLSGGVDGGPL